MNITIGIPTYNRKDLLTIMATSLYQSDLSLKPNIRIYDDHSSDFDYEYLNKLFPNAISIKRNAINLKADRNIYQMYVDFLTTDDAYFFNADSDIIFNKNWLNQAINHIKETDGILSTFNANSHQAYEIINDDFCLKKTLGSAGTLFTRQRVVEMLNYYDNIEKINSFDWQWSKYFVEKNIKLFCLNNSLIQHIGFSGQNSRIYFDVGQGFKVDNIEDGQAINDVLVASIIRLHKKEKKKVNEFRLKQQARHNNFNYHLRRCIIICVKSLLPKGVYQKLKSRIIK